jgi:methylamine dehydrogenase accessory protein MauD
MTALVISNVVLWACVLLLSIVVLVLVWQIGVLHERISPVGALVLPGSLKVGDAAPVIRTTDLAAREVTLGGANPNHRSTLVVFLSPTCPICKTLLPVLQAIRRQERTRVDIVLASDGSPEAHHEFVRTNGLSRFPYVLSSSLGLAYHVSRLPYAVLLDEHGFVRARGLVNSQEHLESLFEAQRLGVANIDGYLGARAPGKVA